jgi:TIR domain
MNKDGPPKVFISYSHDDRDHKRWVLRLGEELRRNGVDPIIDAWDLRPGADVLKFMEHSVINSDRVLLICTEKYVDKMNEGVGGVGYEAMIVTSELMRDVGTAKFIPIIRQNTHRPRTPAPLGSRRYVNLSNGADIAGEMEALLRELHSIPPWKPPLGRAPFAAADSAPVWEYRPE